jgi:hypothetical protein
MMVYWKEEDIGGWDCLGYNGDYYYLKQLDSIVIIGEFDYLGLCAIRGNFGNSLQIFGMLCLVMNNVNPNNKSTNNIIIICFNINANKHKNYEVVLKLNGRNMIKIICI